ncbi:ABC-2 type transport system ATP-binding protein [Pseudoclavibacter sp. JAI123]|jgi:lipopolysaccharide transport system ATP-binding protein|uniref:ABC transporter ATP-binding protein n=1 Tax=Pseudoclavibacter sp. JAI123 TaxID=2723065 RepID=UPI0015C6A4E4|nr:ABC transporter ATP-binding protein [Pseudoclavibacter sp. JAI123]NYF15168.1 ABC-2 type transport system ATP-binding protein [Pseudoclavibacter sp. JAI123]
MAGTAVDVSGVSKTFRIYHDRNQSLKATVLKGGRAKYEEFKALDDVTFEVPEGGTFGLLGRNGSGKSTLLKCIAGILSPNTGTITTRGRIAAMLEVGSGFHPELTGRENVYLNGSILGMSKQQIDNRFDSIVDFSGIEKFIDQPVKNYSSGMYVRLGFAVSIHTEPDVLLVDEVLAVGDMDFQAKCRAKFADFKASGRTVVVVSHGLEGMREFCDRAAWLEQGVLQEVGPATAIIDKYRDSGNVTEIIEGGGQRHGSGELYIDTIELVGESGAVDNEIRTGESPTIRLNFEARRPVERPNFKIAIETLEGVRIWSTSCKQLGWQPDSVQVGQGSMDFHLDRLALAPGEYVVNAEVWRDESTTPVDSLTGSFRFGVHAGTPFALEGVLAMDARIVAKLPGQ